MEEIKKTYYISLDERTVSKVSFAGRNEYEVYATPSDIARFEVLFDENHDRDLYYALIDIPFKPFAEGEVDEMREESEANIVDIYKFIYNFGTKETREKLKSLGYHHKD